MSTYRAVGHGLCVFLLTTMAWAAGGSGTADDPYLISDVHELQAMQADLAAHYALGNDIDASETAVWNGGRGFAPVGSFADPFTGELDGRGHVVSGLWIDRVDDYYVGLLGHADGATIRRVRIEGAEVRGDKDVALLIGKARGETFVTFCSAQGTVRLRPGSSDSKSGGLVGYVGAGARVEQCFSDVEVFASSRRQVGSLVGYLRGVETDWPIATITDSYAAGTVHGNGWKQGNLLGDADGSRVDRSYSSGLGKALIGFNFRNPTITNSYWDSDRGAATSRYGGKPRTTTQMMRQETFVGWDFDQVWGIDEGTGYPYLRWQGPLEMASFEVSPARLSFLGPQEDFFWFGALFSLDEQSDGIEPALEDVRVEVGSYGEVVPAGGLTCRRRCVYRGVEGGIVLLMIEDAPGSDGYFAWIVARGVDLSGTANPMRLSLQVGDDRGTATLRLSGTVALRDSWFDYRR